MPNIKQQKKRVRIAGEERLENLRYRSTIKTLTKRLATAVEDGDSASAEAEHKNLVKWIDRAVARGALHRNAGARKKSQAARIVAGPRDGSAVVADAAPTAAPPAAAEPEAAPAKKPRLGRSRKSG